MMRRCELTEAAERWPYVKRCKQVARRVMVNLDGQYVELCTEHADESLKHGWQEDNRARSTN